MIFLLVNKTTSLKTTRFVNAFPVIFIFTQDNVCYSVYNDTFNIVLYIILVFVQVQQVLCQYDSGGAY